MQQSNCTLSILSIFQILKKKPQESAFKIGITNSFECFIQWLATRGPLFNAQRPIFMVYCHYLVLNLSVVTSKCWTFFSAVWLFHFTLASICLHTSILYKWHHCLKTSSLASIKIEKGKLNLVVDVMKCHNIFKYRLFHTFLLFLFDSSVFLIFQSCLFAEGCGGKIQQCCFIFRVLSSRDAIPVQSTFQSILCLTLNLP